MLIPRLILLSILCFALACENQPEGSTDQPSDRPEEPAGATAVSTNESSPESDAPHPRPPEPPKVADTPCEEPCAETGACRYDDGRCRSTSLGCARSRACAETGKCDHETGYIDGCRQDPDCSEVCDKLGLCHRDETLGCVARTDADCQESDACRDHGACSELDGFCVAVEPEHCENSQGCQLHGDCSPTAGVCRALDSSDCEGRPCREFGRCTQSEKTLSCMATEDSECETPCAYRGACKLKRSLHKWRAHRFDAIRAGKCVVSKDTNCEDTEVCRKKGQCTLRLVYAHTHPRTLETVRTIYGCRKARDDEGNPPSEIEIVTD